MIVTHDDRGEGGPLLEVPTPPAIVVEKGVAVYDEVSLSFVVDWAPTDEEQFDSSWFG
jgi:hypothetical protein